MNGNCAATSAQLPDVKYHLVRVLGRVLGLGWSQTTLNPSPQDIGFTIMHASDAFGCVPITKCYTSADVPKMDDRAALARLYPVTSQNLSSFPGKQIFQTTRQASADQSALWMPTDNPHNRCRALTCSHVGLIPVQARHLRLSLHHRFLVFCFAGMREIL